MGQLHEYEYSHERQHEHESPAVMRKERATQQEHSATWWAQRYQEAAREVDELKQDRDHHASMTMTWLWIAVIEAVTILGLLWRVGVAQ